MKKQFLLRMAALLMAMLMVLAVFAGCKKKKTDDEEVDNSPQAIVRNALGSVASDLRQREELRPLVNALENGSIAYSAVIDAGKMGGAFGNDQVGTAELSGKIYFGDKQLLIKDLNADVNFPTEDIDFEISGDVFLSPDYLYVTNQNVLGGTIGLIRGEMKKSFENSVWKDEIDAETFNVILEALELVDGESLDTSVEEIKALAERYVKVFWDALEDNAKYTEETRVVLIGGENVESRVITVTVDEKALVGLLKDLYNAVKNDAELRSLVVKYGEMLSPYIDVPAEEIGTYYDEALAELSEALNEMEQEMMPGAIIAEIVTPKSASTLRKLTFSIRNGAEGAEDTEVETYVTLDLGKEGIKTSNRIEISFTGGSAIVYTVEQNDSAAYRASLTVSYETYYEEAPAPAVGIIGGAEVPYYDLQINPAPTTNTMTALTVEWNKKSGAFTVSIPEAEVVIGGSMQVAGDTTTIVINSIQAEGESMSSGFSLTWIIDEKDPMPKVLDKNNVTNVFDLTKGNFVDIIDRAEKVFGNLEDLFDNLGIGGKEDVPMDDPTREELVVPYGYQSYNNGDIAFAYPNHWGYQEIGGGECRLTDPNSDNYIAVTREARTSYYENMTEEDFVRDVQPRLEESGRKLLGTPLVQHWGASRGETITEVIYWCDCGGVELYQVLLMVSSGDYTYTVCVSTKGDDSELLSNVYYYITAWNY